MILFNSYQTDREIYCDNTTEEVFPEPNSRVLCHELDNFCYDCNSAPINNGFLLCSPQDSWNCNLCGNDRPFWIPFIEGDFFDFQFQQPNRLPVSCENGWLPTDLLSPTEQSFASFEIRTCCENIKLEITEEMFEVIAHDQFVGKYTVTDYSGNDNTYDIQQIRFNLGAIATYLQAEGLETCFYFVFNFPADNVCQPEAEGLTTFYSEPFKFVSCDDESKTVYIESIYPQFDCFKYYYGANFEFAAGNGNLFNYRNRIRIPGYFERTNFNITKEIINSKLVTTASQYCDNWEIRTFNLPEKFVKYLVNLLTGKNIYINGFSPDYEYQFQGEIQKNNDIGSQWYLQLKFERCECNKSLSCE